MLLHADEFAIDEPLVRRLLSRDCSRVAALPLRRLAAPGSSNVLFRLGDALLVRLPRSPGGTSIIEKEAAWLPVVSPAVPVATPEVVAVGDPGFGYPERWSVTRWLPGDPPDPSAPTRPSMAIELAAIVSGLHAADVPPDAFADPRLRWYRGGPLDAIAAYIDRYLDACRTVAGLDLDIDAAARVWHAALELPSTPAGRREGWLHGDLLAENLLVRDGRIVAVLDFGGLSVGDQAVDLIAAWELLDAAGRELFRARVGVDDATWLRGRAWALAIAVMTFPYYWQTMPERCAARLVMAREVLADAAEQGSRR